MADKGAVFFLAANSSSGFFSLFDELYDAEGGWKAYIIKGGPGTGKSGVMKRVAETAEDMGMYVERIICSSDPDSLDAIIIPQKKICFADGTAPHVMEPKYPGAVEEIINLGECWDSKMLFEEREHILTITDCNKALHKQSARYVAACTAAINDSSKIEMAASIDEKAENYATRFICRNCICQNSKGSEKKRFLSGVTPKGYVTLFDTAKSFCDEIYSVTDENYYAAGMLMEALRRCAIANGIDVITCLNPFLPQGFPLHVILPNERIGFFTSNSMQKFKPIADKNINASRFLDRDTIGAYKKRLDFNKKASAQLLGESIKLLEKAKNVHDKLESYYINAMDYNKLNEKTKDIINAII